MFFEQTNAGNRQGMHIQDTVSLLIKQQSVRLLFRHQESCFDTIPTNFTVLLYVFNIGRFTNQGRKFLGRTFHYC